MSWGRLAAASGLVGVTFTHRLGFPEPRLADAAADVAAALAYVRANAAALHVDPERVCLAAFSAGGPLLSPYIEAPPPHVRCLVGFYPFMDIRQSDLHRRHEPAERVDAFSPITWLASVAGRMPPLFLARAGRDEIPTLLDSVDRFVAEALARNAPLTLANHPEGVHGFDNQDDGPARVRSYGRRSPSWSSTSAPPRRPRDPPECLCHTGP